ncbi:MAG: toxin-antitoxin system HicB family antitoxin [Thermoactinomyces sp.]
MSANKKRFLLRIDQDLYNIIEKWAADEFRSVNAQIEYLLKAAVKSAGRFPSTKSKKPDEDT